MSLVKQTSEFWLKLIINTEENYMYGRILGDSALPVAGIAVLPNTGNNSLLFVIAATSVVIGSLIVISTIARMIAKKVYKD